MPAYSPQGLFPSRPLTGGGYVPAQVMLGILAQESNLWQAPGHVVPGVTGNPLIGNYYGLDIYNQDSSDDWTIQWAEADCGYGVSQVTDGMRLAGKEKPGETALPYQTQRAVALDFAANVAAGVRILQDKWNQTQAAGMTVNNNDPKFIENWFYAVWAYNTGFHPQSEATSNAGAWGVGWSNNPANPSYDPTRAPFLENTMADAKNPQLWPYPEKVMGWSGHPVEILESPGVFVAGYRAANWNGGLIDGPKNRANVKPPLNQFCEPSISCVPGNRYTGNAPGVEGADAGPCGHRNGVGLYDLKCWYNKPTRWKADCPSQCGNELLRFSEGYAYQDDGIAYPPNCSLNGLPSGALVIDDQPDSYVSIRPGCTRPFTNQGTFGLRFATDGVGAYPSKVDLHQLGAGFGGHFWFGHARNKTLRGDSMRITGTWTLNRSLSQWARVMVHLPDHGAQTQEASYEINLGGAKRTRVVLQRRGANAWISLGVFPMSGIPSVTLTTTTAQGDGTDGVVRNEDVAFDAVAFQPLAAKPGNIMVSLGDSYSSGEGSSAFDGHDFFYETDNNGNDEAARNACHRSKIAWSRLATLKDSSTTIGQRSDAWSPSVEHALIACSGARVQNVLPLARAGSVQPADAWGNKGRGQYRETSQLDRGFVDQDTTLVTLSIGGNDVRFADVLAVCILDNEDCQKQKLPGSAVTAEVEVPSLIQGKGATSIRTALDQVRAQAPAAKIVLMGYPRIFAANDSCWLVNSRESTWLASMSDLLNDQMKAVASSANSAYGGTWVSFADPRQDFATHSVCSSSPGIRGLLLNQTPGDKTSDVRSNQSFHPDPAGQQYYANALNRALRSIGL